MQTDPIGPHLALAAIDLGRSIRWDPVKEIAPGDDEANRRLAPKPVHPPWAPPG